MRCFILALLGLILVGCSALHRLERRGAVASLSHVTRKVVKPALRSDTVQLDSIKMRSVVLTPEANGELLMRYDIERVVVRSRARTLPERVGSVDLAFSVSLPRELMGSAWRVMITPRLHRASGVELLDDLVIRGALYDKVDERRQWLGTLRDKASTRLDSVVKRSGSIEYRYVQRVATAGEGKRLSVVLSGAVEALDGSVCRLHGTDTLQFTLSSVLSFVDTTARYVTRVVEKYATAEHRALLSFHSGAVEIAEDLGSNRTELGKIDSLLVVQLAGGSFLLDSITLLASASPEGFAAQNFALTRARAEALKLRLVDRFGAHLDTLITTRPLGEDWGELERLVAADPRFGQLKFEAIGQIADPDRREAELRRRFPRHYALMRQELYPKLRAVRVRLSLRRAGMVQDTIHTTEPDTLYVRGRRLLEERRYAEALEVLDPYKDRNTALTLLSLGQDKEALVILQRLTLSDGVCYLKALAHARLNEMEQARKSFELACAFDPTLQHRVRLDPEMSNFIE